MTLEYKFEPIKKIKELELVEIEKQISKSMPFLEKNFDRILDYIRKEDELENYIEINLPFFGSNLSFKLNLYYRKIMVSVMSHDDSEILGHLLIDGYDCLDKNEIQKLGDWKTHMKNSLRFKEIQE